MNQEKAQVVESVADQPESVNVESSEGEVTE